jgi:hypothetical protein
VFKSNLKACPGTKTSFIASNAFCLRILGFVYLIRPEKVRPTLVVPLISYFSLDYSGLYASVPLNIW